ncbi:MAG: multicopper oxidase domain-containing protein [Roseivirga sp.]|nr:multicopper oxidase domain-containing protein [Roseivirga sp.]
MSQEPKKEVSKENEAEQKIRDSRRDFFKKSMLGAGGLALVSTGTISGCKPTGGSSDRLGMANLSEDRKILLGAQNKEWHSPPEINLVDDLEPFQFTSDNEKVATADLESRKDKINREINKLPYLKALRLDPEVEFSGFPHFLTVDDNGGNTTPGSVNPLFAYNGVVPGPTFRLRGDQDLEVFLINNLSGNDGYWAAKQDARKVKGDERISPDTLDYEIDSHLYGPHQQHVTNLHTHGLHISPGQFKNSQKETSEEVHSDNVLLRVIPVEDFIYRVVDGNGPALMDNEVVGMARYKFKLKQPDGSPHYPGTHWYHPHPHGATFDQVAGGMAGFLIVEGKIDDEIANKFSKQNYTELPLMLQRVLAPPPTEGEARTTPAKGNEKKNKTIVAKVNGQLLSAGIPTTTVSKNQVIRLRLLNGSVDGKGYVRIFIQKSKDNSSATEKVQPVLIDPNQPMYSSGRCGNPKNASALAKRWFTDENSTADRLCLNNIAYDGINLIDKDGYYTDMACEWVTLGVANRTDILVHIPESATNGAEYTIWAQEMNEAVDVDGSKTAPDNLALAKFIVGTGSVTAPALNNDGSLNVDWKSYGQIEELLRPVGVDEITIKDDSETTDAFLPDSPTNLAGDAIRMKASGNGGKAIRSRRIVYSGFGHAAVNAVAYDPDVNITFGDGSNKDLHTMYNAMLIDGKKYGADSKHGHGWDTAQHKMLVNTAEEWSVYNYSMTSYIKDIETDNTDPDNYISGIPSYKLNNPESPLYALRGGLSSNPFTAKLLAKAVHHPFHIHQNAFYVRSVQDYEGNELLPLDDDGNPIPRWQDTVYIPHNGGRAVFRSRFNDYTGKYVNHCHLLQHEDWGMMQAIEVVDQGKDKPNYLPLPIDASEKNNIYPALSLAQIFKLDVGKVKETFSDPALKMLCYSPEISTFFDQTPIKHLTAKQVDDPGYFRLSSFKDKQAQNEKQLGYLIQPVPTDTSPWPKWKNDFKGSTQII